MVYKGKISNICLMASGEGEYLSDLECGGNTSEEEGSRPPVSGSTRGKKTLTRGISGAISHNGSVSSENVSNSSGCFSISSNATSKGVELLVEKSSVGEESIDLVSLLDKIKPSEQRKNRSLKKAPKPPRPPKGPLLNAVDLKLVKELSELAAKKRARLERVKAMRKMKEAKRTSSSSNFTAMIITILFFLVIIFQGVFPRTNMNRESQGSPAPAIASEGLISIQLFNNAPTNGMSGPVSVSHNSWERAFSSSTHEEEGRETG